MMMIPEAWEHDPDMSDERRAFYEYHSCLMEPWDGPAMIAFTDGRQVGAVLDRNGLRPSRYYLTRDDVLVLASEVGVLDIPAEDVVRKGRLQPGSMIMVDTVEHCLLMRRRDQAEMAAAAQPYRIWLDENMVALEDLPEPPAPPAARRAAAAATATGIRLHL